MEMQLALRSDIAMAFDDCTAHPATEAAGARLDGALHALGRAQPRPVLPRRRAIGPGRPVRHRAGRHARALRQASLEALLRHDWPGLAVGGLAVGETEAERLGILEAVVPLMPADRPRYLMGVGRPEDIVAAVLRGVDMFDCVMPTRHARNGHLFTATGVINIRNSAHADRSRADRPRLRLLYLPQLHPCLPAPPGPLQRDPRFAPQHHPQPALLSRPAARTARRHRQRRACRLGPGIPRRPARSRCCGIMPPFSPPGPHT